MNKYKFNENNFDLIRLFAALQVAVHHSAHHLKVDLGSYLGGVFKVLELFPGVPIFFFISGFLISKSYENNPNLLHYSKNRILRLFPGLIICGLVSTITIFLSGYLNNGVATIKETVAWILTQITFFQFYDPDFLGGYGIGQANGSLWTIYIELQFYILIPILYFLFNKTFKARSLFDLWLLVLVISFFLIHYSYEWFFLDGSIARKLLEMTFAPYFYMFLLGVVFQRNFNTINKWLEGRFFFLLFCYFLSYFVLDNILDVRLGNKINPILYVLLCCVVFSAAFSYRWVSAKILGVNDISYGIYIYHMPIVNFLIYIGFEQNDLSIVLAIAATIILAIFSWLLVERPSMKLKVKPLHSLIAR